MNGTVKFGALDLSVLIVYLVGVVAFGLFMGWRQRKRSETGEGYFLAGHSLSWLTIGLALFSTNISALHLVSLAQQGYINGLVFGNFEWMAAFALIALAFFFVPFYSWAIPLPLGPTPSRAGRRFTSVAIRSTWARSTT